MTNMINVIKIDVFIHVQAEDETLDETEAEATQQLLNNTRENLQRTL